jgi:hypothetical protein
MEGSDMTTLIASALDEVKPLTLSIIGKHYSISSSVRFLSKKPHNINELAYCNRSRNLD